MNIKMFFKRGIEYIFHGTPQIKVSAHIVSLAPTELLTGRCALITGGSSGIGFAIAQAFVKADAFVIIAGRDKLRLQASCDKLNAIHKNSAISIQMDMRSTNDIEIAFHHVLKIIGDKSLDILVNNAGVMGSFGISGTTEEMFDDVISTNLKGPFFLSSIVGGYMKDNNIGGNILNITSSSSLRPANSAYGLSKWGMRGFTEGLAKSLAPYGITVNALAPGPTATSMLNKDWKEGIQHPGLLGRHIMPEEIGNMAVVLVSDMGRSIIGDTIYMTGGCGLLTTDDIPCKF